jgi:hypothetical protein
MSMKKTDLICRECRGELIEEQELFICLDCGAEYTEEEAEA